MAVAIGGLAGPSSAEPVPVVGPEVAAFDIPARVLRLAVSPDGDRVYLATPTELLVRDADGAPVTSIAVPDLTDVAVTPDQVILLTRTSAMRQIIRLDGETLVEEERTPVDYGPTGSFVPDLETRTHLTVSGGAVWWEEDEPQNFCGFMPGLCEHMVWRMDLATSTVLRLDYSVTPAAIVAAGDGIVSITSSGDGQALSPATYYPSFVNTGLGSVSDLAVTPEGVVVAAGSTGGFELAVPGLTQTGVSYGPAGRRAVEVAPNGTVALAASHLALFRPGEAATTSSTDLDPGAREVVPDQLRFSPDSSTVYAVLSEDGSPWATGSRKLVVAQVGAPDLGPFDDASTFVAQQYADALGRPATAAEQGAALQALASGQRPGALIAPLVQAEAAANPSRAAIIRLYQAAFLRPPDRTGLEFWLRRYEGGQKLTDIAANFAGSSEFQRRYGALSNADFVKLIFQNVFGRTVDPSGLAYWTGRLDAGRSRGVVLAQWSESSEYVRKMAGLVEVTALYLVMLDRMPTAQEFADAKAALAGGTTLADGADGMLRSAGYAARIAGT